MLFTGLLLLASNIAHPSNLTAGELEWHEIVPGAYFAAAYGDWKSQPHGKFVKFQPGMVVPLHTHTGAYDGVMISGKMVNVLDDGQRVDIEAGHYFQMAADRTHGHECVSEEPCFFYTHSDKAWDLQLIEPEAAE